MSNIQLANNLRHLRKQHELTQKDLSRMLNISRQAYSNYETSKRTPDLDTLLYLSRLYQVAGATASPRYMFPPLFFKKSSSF